MTDRRALGAVVMIIWAAASSWAETPLRGVNIAGLEFTEDALPGVHGIHYTANSEATFAYFAAKGLPLFRVPIRWERIQPELFGELDADYLALVERNIAWAKTHGGRVALDLHNYGRYRPDEGGARREYILDNRYDDEIKVPGEALADLWTRLSVRFRDEPAVYGYGLMNEPHDMAAADWKAISQQTLSAIRAAGDEKTIFVAGDSWSSAERWVQTHGERSWITDPAENFVYEAHLYFDQDASGHYALSYDQELAANPNLAQIGRTRLEPFRAWCRANSVRCFVGEYGVPASDSRWLTVLDELLRAMDEAGMGGTYWAAGDWWHDYALSVQPRGEQAQPQLAVLQRHAGPRFATTVSAAGFQTGPQARGSLVSVYGDGLADATAAAESTPLPVELAGVRVELESAMGEVRPAPLVFVSPAQINCLLPDDIAEGWTELRVRRDGEIVAVDRLRIAAAAPALFAANGAGFGPPAGQMLRIAADGTRAVELLAVFDGQEGAFAPRPIVRPAPEERIFLILYGTGFRHAAPGGGVEFNGVSGSQPGYIGPQPDFPGLDQASVELPGEFGDGGEVRVALQANGARSNELVIRLE